MDEGKPSYTPEDEARGFLDVNNASEWSDHDRAMEEDNWKKEMDGVAVVHTSMV